MVYQKVNLFFSTPLAEAKENEGLVNKDPQPARLALPE
jgi:hypothetical protein